MFAMNSHLTRAQKALAMERRTRSGGELRLEDRFSGMREAIEEIIKYLEEQDQKNAPRVTGSPRVTRILHK
jgi:hypothetical protein